MKLNLTLGLFVCASLSLVGCGPKPSSSDTSGGGAPGAAKTIRIGYIVKDGTQEWFRNEVRFAKEAGAKDGFEVIEVSAPDGGAVMNALDTLATKGCKATVLCTPDVKLGPAIVAACKEKGLKLVTVDDRLVDGAGNPIKDVPYVGISAFAIGQNVGKAALAEAQKRGWKNEETCVMALTMEQLPTAFERTKGAVDSIKASGFPQDRIQSIAHPEQTVQAGYNAADAVLQKHGDCKHWLVVGMADDVVLGGVRRLEKDLKPADVIGIGINGDAAAVAEFKKAEPTGFFGSIQLEARKHGEDTARMAYQWVKEGKMPPTETLTVGTLMTRDNFKAVRKEQGLE
jgi:L-arabinose transport system substrate-binding protein